MNVEIVSLLIDIAILGALGAGIYFAFTLSKALNNFKNNRNELKALIAALTANISKADTAITKLKSESHETADELRKLLSESKMLSEELQLMNDAGNSLAQRLEGLAEDSARGTQSRAAENIESSMNEWLGEEKQIVKQKPKKVKSAGFPFAIQDKELEDDADDDFESEAERELFKALQGKQ